jgi:hypothetical protein
VGKADAEKRSSKIAPHAKSAVLFTRQALDGPHEVAFLPAYYAILNLLKIYILFGAHHAELNANRWHGATYDGYGKNSQSLLTEEIVLKSGGTIPLFYRTVTGTSFGSKARRIRMGDLYPYIANVSAEWQAAGVSRAGLVAVRFAIVNQNNREVVAARLFTLDAATLPASGVGPIKGFARDGATNLYTSKKNAPAGGSIEERVLGGINSSLLYYPHGEAALMPIATGGMRLPEELPITLAFFHLGSVVRYKPEFLAQLRDSRYWPVVSALRVHGLFKMLVLTLSFVRRETVLFKAH